MNSAARHQERTASAASAVGAHYTYRARHACAVVRAVPVRVLGVGQVLLVPAVPAGTRICCGPTRIQSRFCSRPQGRQNPAGQAAGNS
jgi:hypothetical protein